MKVVTRIEVLDVPDRDHIYQMMAEPYLPPAWPISSDGKDCEPMDFSTVNIQGRRFCYGPNDCVVVGWHPQVEEMLNLPLECFENVQRDIGNARREGYKEGKNAIWDFLKINGPDTDYWWLPMPIFIAIAIILI